METSVFTAITIEQRTKLNGDKCIHSYYQRTELDGDKCIHSHYQRTELNGDKCIHSHYHRTENKAEWRQVYSQPLPDNREQS